MRSLPALLFIGGNNDQAIAIETAKKLGFFCIVFDRLEHAPACQIANQVIQVDLTETQKIVDAAKALSVQYRIIGCAGVADFVFGAIGQIYDMLGIVQPNAAKTFTKMTNKAACRQILVKAGIPVSTGLAFDDGDDKARICHNVIKTLSFPVIVKPAHGHGSVGVRTVEAPDAKELEQAIDAITQDTGAGVVEEIVVGRHLNVDGLVVDGTFHPVVISERFFPDDQSHQSNRSILPACLTPELRKNLNDLAAKTVSALAYQNGPITVDIIADQERRVVLEVSPHFHNLTATSSIDGGATVEAWLSTLSGDRVGLISLQEKQNGIAALCAVRAAETGIIESIEHLSDIKGKPWITRIDQRKKSGDLVRVIGKKRPVCFLVWIKHSNMKSLIDAADQIEQTIQVKTVGLNP